jgi:hypothetical protein
MRHLFALGLLLALCAVAQTQTGVRITVLEYGLVTGKPFRDVTSPRTASGFTRQLTDFRITQQADTVTAQQGVRFGFRYRVDGAPDGAILRVKCAMRFPDGGVVNAKGQRVKVDEYDCDLKIGEITWRSYTFDEAWEMVPGRWTFEFWYGGEKIGEKRFTVVAP